MIPDAVRQRVERFLPNLRWNDVEIIRGLPPYVANQIPQSTIRRSVGRVTGRASGARAMKTIGATFGHKVYLNEDYADFDTAAGLALITHELHHVHQEESIPGFEELYADEAVGVPENRPWENRYEFDAYLIERNAFCAFVYEDDLPKGDWTPLGVQLWGCDVPAEETLDLGLGRFAKLAGDPDPSLLTGVGSGRPGGTIQGTDDPSLFQTDFPGIFFDRTEIHNLAFPGTGFNQIGALFPDGSKRVGLTFDRVI